MDHVPAVDGSAPAHPLPELRWQVQVRQGDRNDHRVAAVRGVLSAPPGDDRLRQVLCSQLLDRGRVVVDLSEATVPWDPVVEVFPTALADAGGWPLARLVLAGADPLTCRVLQVSRVHLTVPLARTLAEARLLLDARPLRVVRDQQLPCDPMAPQLAHMAVASACDDWEFDDGLYEAAATVARELVCNAVEHGGTSCVLHLALDRRRLQVAVRDTKPLTEGSPHIAVPCAGRYGLLIVQALCRSWGVAPKASGKTVWAMLDAERDPLN